MGVSLRYPSPLFSSRIASWCRQALMSIQPSCPRRRLSQKALKRREPQRAQRRAFLFLCASVVQGSLLFATHSFAGMTVVVCGVGMGFNASVHQFLFSSFHAAPATRKTPLLIIGVNRRLGEALIRHSPGFLFAAMASVQVSCQGTAAKEHKRTQDKTGYYARASRYQRRSHGRSHPRRCSHRDH